MAKRVAFLERYAREGLPEGGIVAGSAVDAQIELRDMGTGPGIDGDHHVASEHAVGIGGLDLGRIIAECAQRPLRTLTDIAVEARLADVPGIERLEEVDDVRGRRAVEAFDRRLQSHGTGRDDAQGHPAEEALHG